MALRNRRSAVLFTQYSSFEQVGRLFAPNDDPDEVEVEVEELFDELVDDLLDEDDDDVA